MHRIYLAFLCFFRILFGRRLPDEVLPALPAPAPAKDAVKALPAPEPKPAAPAKPGKIDVGPGALQLLALFQREGRLIDFLSETIDAYEDAAIGAAVRDIHRGCKKVLAEHFAVEPVVEGEENESYTVDEGFDPVRIRLTGNVVGKPPFKGLLKHHGWRASKVALPTFTATVDHTVVAPAEVELP